MNRRDFLKAAGLMAVAAAAPTSVDGESKPMDKLNPAAPCGLYCAICADYTSGTCHGCKCTCGKCIGAGHAKVCAIYQCATAKRLKSCSECPDLPCTQLIQFTVDPVWRTHLQCIENLRRQKKIGVDAWLHEQETYRKDEKAPQALAQPLRRMRAQSQRRTKRRHLE